MDWVEEIKSKQPFQWMISTLTDESENELRGMAEATFYKKMLKEASKFPCNHCEVSSWEHLKLKFTSWWIYQKLVVVNWVCLLWSIHALFPILLPIIMALMYVLLLQHTFLCSFSNLSCCYRHFAGKCSKKKKQILSL